MAKPEVTGRELIIYILSNHLENSRMLVNGHLIAAGNDFMIDEKVASTLGVGMATVKVWYENDYFEGAFREDGTIYVPKDEIIRILSEKLKEAGVRI